MAIRDKPTRGHSVDSEPTVGSALRVYDVILTVIPVAFLAGLVATLFTTVSLQTSMVAAALFGLLVVLDALFVHPPSGIGDD